MNKLFDLTGKVALVTGGNGGIGLGIARGLQQAGASAAIVARNTEKSQRAARALAEETGVEPLVVTADVSQPDQVAAAVANTPIARSPGFTLGRSASHRPKKSTPRAVAARTRLRLPISIRQSTRRNTDPWQQQRTPRCRRCAT